MDHQRDHGRAWWRRPDFGDPEQNSRAATLWRITLVFLAFGVPGPLIMWTSPEWQPGLPLALLNLAAWVVSLRLIQLGSLKATAWLLVLGLWVGLAISTVVTGGIESPVIATLVICVLAAGLLLDTRGTVAVTALATATVAALVGCHQLGILFPSILPTTPMLVGWMVISSFAGACVLIACARMHMRTSRQLSKRYAGQLEERNRQLERAESRYREINELTSEFFYSLRRAPDGRVENELLSDNFQRMTGYTPEQLDKIARSWSAQSGDASPAERDASATEGPVVCDHRLVTPSGKVRWIRDRSRITYEADGSQRRYGSAHDITDAKRAEAERERLEAELRQSQKMEAVGRLAGGIAHDFNNLLMAISGFGELLLDETRPGDEANFAAQQVLAAADSAAELTQQLMAFSRRPSHRHGSVDVNNVLDSIEPMLSRVLGETVEIRLALADDAIRTSGQQSLIEQVILNLALNARDAMPLGGRLTISTESVPRGSVPHLDPTLAYLHIRVSDDGDGMSAAVAARAFEPFFTTKEIGEGTGLGLSTVYGIVQQCGGSIEVESAADQGTRFDIYLPEAKPAELLIDELKADRKRPGLTPKRVLVVEDDDRVRNLLYRSLSRGGHTVLEAREGAEALALIEREKQHIDLLVSDIVMPGVDGVELSERISDAHPGIRVLLISGYSSRPGSRGRVLPPEAAFLQKPFGPRGLERKLEEVFSGEWRTAGY